MTDAYIFDVHTDADVRVIEGKKVVPVKHVFDWKTMAFSLNADQSLTREVVSRHKDGRVFSSVVRLTKEQYCKVVVPADCYQEKSC